jgi:hypothetical protein
MDSRTSDERHAGWLAIRLARRCNDRTLQIVLVLAAVLVLASTGGFPHAVTT